MDTPEPDSWQYTHKRFPPGTAVYIVPDIRDIHPQSLIAGRSGVAVEGTTYANLNWFYDRFIVV